MAWRLLKQGFRVVTNALAKEFAEMTPAPGDRELREERAEDIRTAIVAGKFSGCMWASVFCKEDGKTYRVNGKHTSKVLSEMNGSKPKDLELPVYRYEVDTLQDVAELYATYDRRRSVRTTRDINRSYAKTHPLLEPLPQKVIDLAVTGMAIAKDGLNYTTRPAEERAARLHDEPQFPLWIFSTIGGRTKDNEHVFRGAVGAVMYESWTAHKGGSTEFWPLIAIGSTNPITSIDRKLNRFLLKAIVGSSRSATTTDRCDSKTMLDTCRKAWAAWLMDLKGSRKLNPSQRAMVAARTLQAAKKDVDAGLGAARQRARRPLPCA